MSGFRATVVVHDPGQCPVAAVSTTSAESIDSVHRTRPEADGEPVVEEFSASPETPQSAVESAADAELMPVQHTDQEVVYRFERDGSDACACEVVEETGTPIGSVRAQDGSLLISFRTFELDAVAEIVDDLRAQFDGVIVEELAQDHAGSSDRVVVDRDVLTTRQREIIDTAHELGYFDYPKGANASEVADELGVARSTFTEHLAAAETKLLDAILES
ncbi:bacterio-opsin activator [Salinadaptatus halalkaliphilus]|uniref:Bacterio-opsin activator n=1 Tax=Salinadaptatus halalkaliphilus TaxID=2419781 RepID=A0A4S3TJU8_9EURY|nr:helix-turn-helix domain-containing protein [Salinadaptatus halalkaliphilus]THE63840.1 bacterio-opsin activator [Salinadaptatus halalkaliphilus]